MNFLIRYGMFLAAGISFAPIMSASADTSSVSDLKLGAPEPRNNFYFKVDTGAVFLRPPDKDNGNFSIASDPFENVNGQTVVASQPGDAATWSLGGTFGYYLPVHPDAWLGQNLRVEVAGNYFQTSDTESSAINIGPGGTFATVGRLDGNYTGANQSTDIGSITGGPNPVAGEQLTTKDTFYQVGSAIRSDYIFDHGQLVLSPKYGFQYSHLDQNFHTTADGNRGSVDQREDIDTSYYGPDFGLELKMQLTKMLVYYAEGDISPLYAESSYNGYQSGTSTKFGGGAGSNSATDSHDTFAFKAGFGTGVYCDFGKVILKMGGGFDYWSYVATVREASLPVNSNTFSLAAPFSVQPSHLIDSSMLNPTVKLSIIVPF